MPMKMTLITASSPSRTILRSYPVSNVRSFARSEASTRTRRSSSHLGFSYYPTSRLEMQDKRITMISLMFSIVKVRL